MQVDEASTPPSVILIACDADVRIPVLMPMAARMLAAALLLLLAPHPAQAQAPPSLRWSYSRGRGAERCPDEPAMRRAITAQLGRDPFAGGAASEDDDSVALEVRRADKQLRARIELRRHDGAVLGARELRGDDCAELAPAMTLAIAMAIDTLTSRPPPAPSPAIESPPPPPVPQADDDEIPRIAKPPPPPPVAWNLSLGLLGAVDAANLLAPGLTLQVDVVRGGLSLGVELRGDLPTTARTESSVITASLWTGTLLPCLRHKIAGLCGLISMGGEMVTVGSTVMALRPLSSSYFWFGLGIRTTVELPLYKMLALRLHADVIAPLMRHQVPPAGFSVIELYYVTPPVSSSFGMALMAIFP
jgi:hypothetical protein